ncbi:MAG TPA: septal ring lytic transglycosylase RlpA family protein [Methylotenera sp.]|nr:septal ring lytic transglycosylase RlpA family protein [Methylotenera sp.]HPH05129.1 septal ring lytic transglycosylase RlpA family protein [Methylotenera sp.]HPN00493.1 septal ring lytic transglycosylase RlpA family protein [Methylotenera sp.]
MTHLFFRRKVIRVSHVLRYLILLFTLSVLLFSPLQSDAKSKQKQHTKTVKVQKSQVGVASFYAKKFHGRRTASGEIFNNNDLTAAHLTLPFGTKVKVTRLKTGKSVIVRINDRGPHVRGRIIDLSYGAAKKIGLVQAGTARVRIEVVQ